MGFSSVTRIFKVIVHRMVKNRVTSCVDKLVKCQKHTDGGQTSCKRATAKTEPKIGSSYESVLLGCGY